MLRRSGKNQDEAMADIIVRDGNATTDEKHEKRKQSEKNIPTLIKFRQYRTPTASFNSGRRHEKISVVTEKSISRK